MSEPCDLPAVTARALIGERKLSPVELMDSCIRRIEEIDPAVNAVIAHSFETARATAQESEAAVMRGDTLGPLHGLPLGVKDLIDAKGLPTSFGSVLFADNIAAEDESIVAMLMSVRAFPSEFVGGSASQRRIAESSRPSRRPTAERLPSCSSHATHGRSERSPCRTRHSP